jgi:hypothetical protein
MDREELRWRWYFDRVSPATRRHLYRLSDEEWRRWLERAAELSHKRGVHGIENTFTPPLADWERDCFHAMLALAGENTGSGWVN